MVTICQFFRLTGLFYGRFMAIDLANWDIRSFKSVLSLRYAMLWENLIMTSAFLKVSVDREEACPFTLFFLRGGGWGWLESMGEVWR